MTIQYSCIARPSIILCSHQIGAGNFDDLARSMLPNISANQNSKITYTSNNFLFHVVTQNGLVYMCAADPDFGKQQPYAYLTEIQNRFESSSLIGRSQVATEGELNRDFAQVMARQMETFSQPERSDALSQMRAQVEEVKGIMTQNIEKVLERGDKLEDLVETTNQLEAHSNTFAKTTKKVQRKMWWRNRKMTLILAGVVVLVLFVIIMIILASVGVFDNKGGGGGSTTPATPAP